MRRVGFMAAAIVACISGAANTQEPDAESVAIAQETRPRWDVDVGAGLLFIGHGRQTGGLSPSLTLWRSMPLGERWRFSFGGDVSGSGFGAPPHWASVLTGPTVAVSWKASKAVSLGAAARLDLGRLATCNQWKPAAYCMNFWGFYPGVEPAVQIRIGGAWSAGAAIGARVVRTMLWSGASVEPVVTVRASL